MGNLQQSLELAWMAGFFDGEGCVYIDKPDRMGRQTMRLQLSNTIPSLLLPFEQRWGGKIHTRKNGEHCKDIWVWVCYSTEAKSCLEDLLPYLRFKSAAAVIGIRFQNLKTGDNNLNELRKHHPRRKEIYAERLEAYHELRAINKRGAA